MYYWAKLLGTKLRPYELPPPRRTMYVTSLSGESLTKLLERAKPYFRGDKEPIVKIILEHRKFYIPYKPEEPPPPRELSLAEPNALLTLLPKKVAITPTKPARLTLTPEQKARVIEMRMEGHTIMKIAEEIDVHPSTIYRHLPPELR